MCTYRPEWQVVEGMRALRSWGATGRRLRGGAAGVREQLILSVRIRESVIDPFSSLLERTEVLCFGRSP